MTRRTREPLTLAQHYLAQLERLARLFRDFDGHLNALGMVLLERSMRAAYRECCDAGAEAEAVAVLRARRLA